MHDNTRPDPEAEVILIPWDDDYARQLASTWFDRLYPISYSYTDGYIDPSAN